MAKPKCIATVVAAVALAVATFAPAVSSSKNNRPPFLSHVAKENVLDAVAYAKTKHNEAVQTALRNYPIDTMDEATAAKTVESISLKRYEVASSSSLPDFHDELGTCVFVTDPPLLTREECDEVIQFAEQHFQETSNGRWSLQDSGQYKVAGFYINQIPSVNEWFLRKVKTKLFPMLQRAFPDFVESPDDLCVDNSYLFKYTPETGRRTEIHTDSGCLSFTIALSPKEDYEGGGTWFDGYGVLNMNQGQVTLRPGGLKHCGYAVTGGTRYIIGGFCMHKRKAEPVRMLLSHGLHSTDLLEAALAINPGVDSAYNILASRYEAQAEFAKAQSTLEYCLEHVNPTSGESSYSLGTLHLSQGRAAQALECMKLCLETDPYDVDAMLGVAQCSSALGDSGTEEQYCRNIVETPGVNKEVLATAYCNLGVIHAGEEIELEYYRSSIDISPNSFAPKYSLASALAARERWPEAIDNYKKALENENDTDNRKRALTAMYRCVVRLLQSKQAMPATKEGMILLFHENMGKEFFEEMAAMQSSSS